VDPRVIRQNVDKAAKLIDEMLEDVMREMFVAQAAAYITEEAPELEETQVGFLTVVWSGPLAMLLVHLIADDNAGCCSGPDGATLLTNAGCAQCCGVAH
jgi:hypothetical protein